MSKLCLPMLLPLTVSLSPAALTVTIVCKMITYSMLLGSLDGAEASLPSSLAAQLS
jgi:hypothetical protein